jgi:hypothetical protein
MKDILRKGNVNYIKGEEWVDLSALIQKEKLSVVLGEAIYSYCPQEYQIYLDEIIMQARNNSVLYLKELCRLDALFKSKGVSYILMKGMPLSKQIYNDCFVRISSDIDMLVDEDKMKMAYTLLNKMGYRQHVYFDKDRNLFTIDKNSSIYGNLDHEIKCIKKLRIKDFAGVEIQKATTAIPFQYIEDFKKNTIEMRINNLSIKTTNVLYSFLHLIANAYENSETIMGTLRNCGIKDYFDLMISLQKYHDTFDWSQISDLAEKYRIKHMFLAVFLNCRDLFGDDLINDTLIRKFEKWNYPTLCTPRGYIIDWVSPFDERIINEKIRIKETYSYLRRLIPQRTSCKEFKNSDVLSLTLIGNSLEIRFKWIYYDDERFVISILNNIPKDTLFSDIYIKKNSGKVESFYCNISNIKGITNELVKLHMEKENDIYVINIDVSKLIIDKNLFFKVLKQKSILDDYFIRIYLDKKFDFFENTFRLQNLSK